MFRYCLCCSGAPPAEKNAFSLSVQPTNTKYMFLRRTLGAKGRNGTQPIAAYHAKAEWLTCQSSSVRTTTNTRLLQVCWQTTSTFTALVDTIN